MCDLIDSSLFLGKVFKSITLFSEPEKLDKFSQNSNSNLNSQKMKMLNSNLNSNSNLKSIYRSTEFAALAYAIADFCIV